MPIKSDKLSKRVLLLLPPGLLEEINDCAKEENRTRSAFFREAARRYLWNYRMERAKDREAQRKALMDRQTIIGGKDDA